MDIIHNNKPLSIYFDIVDNSCDEQCLSIKIIDTAIIIYKCTYVFNKLDNKNLFNNDIRVCIDMFTDLIKSNKYDITYENHSIILNIHISFMSYFNYTYVFTCIEENTDIESCKNTIVKLYNKIDILETKINELQEYIDNNFASCDEINELETKINDFKRVIPTYTNHILIIEGSNNPNYDASMVTEKNLDWKYYITHHYDLLAAGIKSSSAAYGHFNSHGRNEKRQVYYYI